MTDTWKDRAACIGQPGEWFFPEGASGGGASPGAAASIKKAKAFCALCSVRAECLDYALDNKIEHGVWGGLSVRQRRTARTQRRQKVAS